MENSVTAIILAGGKSERMGIDKGLLTFNNSYWVLEQIKRISKTGIKNLYIGLGYNYETYFSKIDWFEKATKEAVLFSNVSINIILNKNPENGSFSTLQKILKNVPSNQDVLINPIDIPLLNTKELEQIIKGENWITIPKCKDKNGHPIKLKGIVWKDFLSLNKTNPAYRLDLQLKKIASTKKTYVAVSDEAILLNTNTLKEWEYYLTKL